MRTLENGVLACTSRPARAAVLSALLMIAAWTVTGRAAEAPDVTVSAAAQRIAITVCGTCHGPTGDSQQPKFPRLASQDANYLTAQLKAFRTQTRGDPDAIGYMWGMASELDDPTIEALAAYYSVQKATTSGRSADPGLAARGRDIYQHGIPQEGVPACSSCHGADAHGLQDFPRLAGQHAQYIMKQLASFQSNMRNVAIMHGVAQNLRVPEMQAVAAYLQAQP